MNVEKKRHIAKTVSYRVFSTLIGFVVMLALTGSVYIGTTFSLIELFYKPFQYYIHERIWYRWVKYGLKKEKQ